MSLYRRNVDEDRLSLGSSYGYDGIASLKGKVSGNIVVIFPSAGWLDCNKHQNSKSLNVPNHIVQLEQKALAKVVD